MKLNTIKVLLVAVASVAVVGLPVCVIAETTPASAAKTTNDAIAKSGQAIDQSAAAVETAKKNADAQIAAAKNSLDASKANIPPQKQAEIDAALKKAEEQTAASIKAADGSVKTAKSQLEAAQATTK